MENSLQKQARQVRDRDIDLLYPKLTMRKIALIYGISTGRVKQILDKAKAVDKLLLKEKEKHGPR